MCPCGTQHGSGDQCLQASRTFRHLALVFVVFWPENYGGKEGGTAEENMAGQLLHPEGGGLLGTIRL